tara:strand:- start:7676 stop:8308 length:633 start_codon:yes stop_codon:yes gene_type:complete
MLRKLKLHGELAKFVGQDEFEAVMRTSAEAIRFLVTNFPKVEAYMSDKYYQVLVGKEEIDKEDLHNPTGQSDIHIVPVITGAGGRSPFGRILLGAALIGASFLFPGAGMFGTYGLGKTAAATGFTAAGIGTAIGTGLSVIGAGLVLNGVSELLFPLPTPDEQEDDPRISFAFNGLTNTSRAGTAHPIVYGEIVTGSVVISAGIDTNQVKA